MKFKHLKVYLIGTVIVLLFAGFTDIYFEINKNLELFGKVYKEISFNYVDEVDPEQFMRAGIQGMLASLDPYTIFIDEKKKEDIDLITNGKYGGIGISIGVRDDKVSIVEVMEGYSAQRQGLEVGDIIIEAAGVKDTIDFDVVREEVIIKNLTYAGFYPEGSNNLYLKLSNFSRSASEEIRDAIKDAKAQKEIKSVILDLRGNPGGLLDIAVDICDKFLPKDYLIVSTKGRSPSSIKEFYSTQEPLLKDAKLIVLIDGGSASASEIVAGAIQDHDRGIILGTKSFGKGLVQTITPLSYNTSLKITTAKYYTPSGRCIQKIDYSDNNDVIAEEDSIVSGKFLTDHKRVVYSKGGISPDTTIAFNIEGRLTQELLAHGLFFKFANHYYYQHTDENYNSIKDEDLLTQFKDFINNENFVYKSDAEDHVDELISDLSGNYPNLTNEVGRLKAEITNLKKNDFNLYKDEILRELRTEIAYRYLGSDARIKEQLNGDMQFQSALNIFNNPIVYNKLLHLN
ncbi:MAG: S41 family peptidase [Ignavibacteriaceae bacterium]